MLVYQINPGKITQIDCATKENEQVKGYEYNCKALHYIYYYKLSIKVIISYNIKLFIKLLNVILGLWRGFISNIKVQVSLHKVRESIMFAFYRTSYLVKV